jgi:hypothetical protein
LLQSDSGDSGRLKRHWPIPRQAGDAKFIGIGGKYLQSLFVGLFSMKNSLKQFEIESLPQLFVDTGTMVVDKNNLKDYREGLPAHPKSM